MGAGSAQEPLGSLFPRRTHDHCRRRRPFSAHTAPTALGAILFIIAMLLQALTATAAPGENFLQVRRVTPSGNDVTPGRQLLLEFDRPMVPLGAMDRRGEQLPIRIDPPLNCHWRWLDAVTSPRQPGSTLKPFLYGLALEEGWTAATQIDDSPLSGQVGDGAHPFRNYSRHHYGPLPLRQALGNSLNLPAIRTVRHTGVDPFFERLRAVGMDSLDRNATHYGEGLALGNGEVTLLELVRGYAVLARSGIFRPLRPTFDVQYPDRPGQRVFSAEAASLIADILADPQVRRLEFGDGSILRFSKETAVKTGTSNDHRDAWALGFDSHHTVGVWMGNFDGRSTLGLSGASGPALVLRALFSELQRRGETKPLWRSSRLERHAICMASGVRAAQGCASIDELFLPGTAPTTACTTVGHQGPAKALGAPAPLRLVQPTPGLLLALDPHIPDELEAYALRFGGGKAMPTDRVEWLINGQVVGTTSGGEDRFLWPLRRGAHLAQARLHRGGEVEESPKVAFTVK